MSLAVVISTFGCISATVLYAARGYLPMAQDGLFFSRLARLHPHYRTPAAALVLQGGWAILLTLTGGSGELLDYVVFGDWIFFGATAATISSTGAAGAGMTGRGESTIGAVASIEVTVAVAAIAASAAAVSGLVGLGASF